MAAGDPFDASEKAVLDRTIRRAEELSRAEFSVFVGRAVGEPRAFATSLHNTLVAPSRSVLIMIDVDARAIEVVTGGEVRRRLSDAEVELAVIAMQGDFTQGDLVGGLKHGIELLAEHAQAPRTLHSDT